MWGRKQGELGSPIGRVSTPTPEYSYYRRDKSATRGTVRSSTLSSSTSKRESWSSSLGPGAHARR